MKPSLKAAQAMFDRIIRERHDLPEHTTIFPIVTGLVVADGRQEAG